MRYPSDHNCKVFDSGGGMCVCVFCVGRMFFNIQMFVTLCHYVVLCVNMSLY